MFEFSIDKNQYPKIHFIGIGGVSMSGLAEILLNNGYKVSGSDRSDSKTIKKLRSLGAEIYIEQAAGNINNPDLVIYTDAIAKDNDELQRALELGVPVVDRATFLGALMKNYETSVGISGTHGKTTTTSMLSIILNNSPLDPTILLGGELDEIGGNIRLGTRDLILTEACEYKGNILKYFPKIAVILNIDEDHLDFFKSLDHIRDTFVQYAANLSSDSTLIINLDDPSAEAVIAASPANVITFGIESDADFKIENIAFSEKGYPSFSLNYKNIESYDIELNVMGVHNIYNSVASIIAAKTIGLSMDLIAKNIKLYKGVARRLELKGYYNGVKLIDDYAHHPTEIRATLSAIRKSTSGKIYCIFQPHTFTRTKLLLKSFSEAFSEADKVIITDIYAAREKDNGIVHSRNLNDAIKKNGIDATYIKEFEDIRDYLISNIQEEDVVITMGAGNVYSILDLILDLKKSQEAV